MSIATLDDMKALYAGFDLCAPTTSVSMTINGPAPTILAMFLNTAIDQQLARSASRNGRQPTAAEAVEIRARTLRTVRGTVQADILKEDQGQNTCIFSTEFSLRCMADIAEWFVQHEVRNFYSVSISGYHIAEEQYVVEPGKGKARPVIAGVTLAEPAWVPGRAPDAPATVTTTTSAASAGPTRTRRPAARRRG